MQTVSFGDNLQGMSKLFFRRKESRLLNFLPTVLSINMQKLSSWLQWTNVISNNLITTSKMATGITYHKEISVCVVCGRIPESD